MERKDGKFVQNTVKKGLVGFLLSLLIMVIGMYLLSGVLLFIISAITYYGDLSGKIVEIGILVIYLLVCLIGGFITGKIKKSKRFLWGMAAGTGYFLVLLIVSLAMNGFAITDTVGLLTVLVICVGSGAIGGIIS